jgi:hypothetical protein
MKTDDNLTAELIAKVKEGKHQQFQFIRSWHEYTKFKQLRRAYKLLIGSIKKTAKKLIKKYYKAANKGKANPMDLFTHLATLEILDFYEEEFRVVTDMIYEYEAYLMEGNLIDAWLFNDYRPSDKLFDHRSD